MKRLTQLIIVSFVFSLYLSFSLPISANDSSNGKYASPDCQALFKGANPTNFSPEVVDMCLITGYIRTPDGSKAGYTSYENEPSNPLTQTTQITSENIPENVFCSQDKPQCPLGSITLANGKTLPIKGTCQLTNSQSKKGLCVYTREVKESHPIRALDFADPLAPTNIQTYNALYNKQLVRLLSLNDKLRYSLDLLFKKLAPSSDQVRNYLGAIDPDTEFSCDDQSITYTLLELKKLIPENIITLYQQQDWQQLNDLYQQALLTDKEPWAQLVTCLPLSPFSPEDVSSRIDQAPGFTYMKMKISFKGLGFNLPATSGLYPTNPQAAGYFGPMVWLLNTLSVDQQIQLQKQLQQTNPLALAFFPEQDLTTKQQFFKTYQPTNNAYTLTDYAETVINMPKQKSPNLALPKHITPDQIEEANAVDTNGFPANLKDLTKKILAAAGIQIEKHFLTIPSLNQQVLDLVFKTQLQLQLPVNQQQLLTQAKDQPIALKGSTYAGGLEYLQPYLGWSFSGIMPYSFNEYCPIQTQIKDYVTGQCNPQLFQPTSNPFLSP